MIGVPGPAWVQKQVHRKLFGDLNALCPKFHLEQEKRKNEIEFKQWGKTGKKTVLMTSSLETVQPALPIFLSASWPESPPSLHLPLNLSSLCGSRKALNPESKWKEGSGSGSHALHQSNANLQPLVCRPSTTTFWTSAPPFMVVSFMAPFWASTAPEFWHWCGSGPGSWRNVRKEPNATKGGMYVGFFRHYFSGLITSFSFFIWQKSEFWALICKRLRNPGIDSWESIPPVYVAWRVGTRTQSLLGSWPP